MSPKFSLIVFIAISLHIVAPSVMGQAIYASDVTPVAAGTHRLYEGNITGRFLYALIILCIVLEVTLLVSLLWAILRDTQCCLLGNRTPRPNAERERADQVLNGHPPPIDIELGIIHARSTPQWPLTDHVYPPQVPPNSPISDRAGRNISDSYGTSSMNTEATPQFHEDMDHDGADSDADTASTQTQQSDIMQLPATEASDYVGPALTPAIRNREAAVSVSGSESSAHNSCTSNATSQDTYELEAPRTSPKVDTNAQNGVIVRDWAYM
ncbi:hypothetical protein F4861DRAFT_540861 [Xylaria intraflava]|nr:hypothetical protein F4861DRAFT_540861 [Xylaria intraflava]